MRTIGAPVKDLEESFDARLYGYDDMEDLLDDFPEYFVLTEGDGNIPCVHNEVPEEDIQDLKNAILQYNGNHRVHWVRLENIEPPYEVDWRRFGYETFQDVLEDQSEHFLVQQNLLVDSVL